MGNATCTALVPNENQCYEEDFNRSACAGSTPYLPRGRSAPGRSDGDVPHLSPVGPSARRDSPPCDCESPHSELRMSRDSMSALVLDMGPGSGIQSPTEGCSPRLAVPPRTPRVGEHPRKRSNSTSSVFLGRHVIQHPDDQSTIGAVARYVANMIGPVPAKEDRAEELRIHRPFYPSKRYVQKTLPPATSLKVAPSSEDVGKFIRDLYQRAQMTSETLIATCAYMDRIRVKGVPVNTATWRNVLYGCMMLASKIYDDLSMVNGDFAYLSGFSIRETNRLEAALLLKMDWDIWVSGSEYAVRYFALRATASARELPSSITHQKEALEILGDVDETSPAASGDESDPVDAEAIGTGSLPARPSVLADAIARPCSLADFAADRRSAVQRQTSAHQLGAFRPLIIS